MPGRNLQVIGGQSLREETALLTQIFDDGLQPDLGPVIADQFGHGNLGAFGYTDVDEHAQAAFAVRPQPVSGAVALGQADGVEKRVGAFRVILGVGRGPFLLEETQARIDGGREGSAQTEEEGVVHALAIDADRQGDAEVLVVEQLPQNGVFDGAIGHQAQFGGEEVLCEFDAIVPLFSALLEDRHIFHIDIVGLEVELAGAGLEGLYLFVTGDHGLDTIDIGQLVAGGVDLMEVGVAHNDGAVAGEGFVLPGPEGRTVDAEVIRRSVVEVEGLHPGLKSLFLSQLLGIGVVVDVPLLQPVLGHDDVVVGGHARATQVVHDDRVGHAEADFNHRVTDFGEDCRFTSGAPDRPRPGRGEVFIHCDIFPGEHDVVGRERLAIRPLMALTQFDGQGFVVIGEVVVFGDVHEDLGVGEVIPEEPIHAQGGEAPQIDWVDFSEAQGASVGADPVLGFNHLRLCREPLIDGRQLAVGDHFGQHGGFVIGGRRLGLRALGLGCRFRFGRLDGCFFRCRLCTATGSEHGKQQDEDGGKCPDTQLWFHFYSPLGL